MSAHFYEKIKMWAKSISALLFWRLLNGPQATLFMKKACMIQGFANWSRSAPGICSWLRSARCEWRGCCASWSLRSRKLEDSGRWQPLKWVIRILLYIYVTTCYHATYPSTFWHICIKVCHESQLLSWTLRTRILYSYIQLITLSVLSRTPSIVLPPPFVDKVRDCHPHHDDAEGRRDGNGDKGIGATHPVGKSLGWFEGGRGGEREGEVLVGKKRQRERGQKVGNVKNIITCDFFNIQFHPSLFMCLFRLPSTGWPIKLSLRFCWHQNRSSVLVNRVNSKMQPLLKCKKTLRSAWCVTLYIIK